MFRLEGRLPVVGDGESGALHSSSHPRKLLCLLHNPKYVISSVTLSFSPSDGVRSPRAPEAVYTSVATRRHKPSSSTFSS